MLSSFFFGYLATQALGGWLGGRYGAKHVAGCGMLLSAAATVLLPAAARITPYLVIVLRVIVGAASVSRRKLVAYLRLQRFAMQKVCKTSSSTCLTIIMSAAYSKWRRIGLQRVRSTVSLLPQCAHVRVDWQWADKIRILSIFITTASLAYRSCS